MVIAFDPGTKVVGVAVFSDAGELQTAYLVRGLGPLDVVSKVNATGQHIFVEYPRVYPSSVSKGDPNDLIQVALVSGGLAARVAKPGNVVRLVCAPEWTNVPKDIQNRRTLKALTDVEKARIEPCPASLRHNVVDAVGLGLWALTRLGIQRTDGQCQSKTSSAVLHMKSATKPAKRSSKRSKVPSPRRPPHHK